LEDEMIDDIKKAVAEEVARQLAELKAKEAPPKSTFVEESDAEFQNRLHQMRERRMNLASNFHPDDLRAMEAACPTSTAQDLWRHGTVQSPSMGGATGQVTGVHLGGGPSPSRTLGHVEPTPLSNPPGTNWVDAIAIADDVRQRAELARKLKP
jgi:hypothetical protein